MPMFRNLSLLSLLTLLSFAAPAIGQGGASIRFLDRYGQPLAAARQLTDLLIEVTDPASAGQGYVLVDVASEIRGHTLFMQGFLETAPGSGIFLSEAKNLRPQHPWEELPAWGLAVTEDPGPPHRFDTVRATLHCGTPPCAEATIPTYASSIRFLDSQSEDRSRIPVGEELVIEGLDDAVYGFVVTLFAQPGGDFETRELPYDWTPESGVRFRGTVPTAAGPAVPGDGILQIDEGGTLTASHDNYLGLSSTEASLATGSESLRFLDRHGEPADVLLVFGKVRLRLVSDPANADPGSVETVTASLRSVDGTGATRDSEPVVLTESGPSTGIFEGEIGSYMDSYPQPGNGYLSAWQDGTGLDDIEATFGAQTATATLAPAFVRIVDANGTPLSELHASDPVRIEVESDFDNRYWVLPNDAFVRLRSLTTGDDEPGFQLFETGDDSSIFTGSFSSVESATPNAGDGALQVQPRETVTVEYSGIYGTASASVPVAFVPLPPAAVDDLEGVDEDQPESLWPAANDLNPDQGPISIESVSGAGHGQVVILDPATGEVSYLPESNYHGPDSFTYTLNGGSTGTVSIIVSSVPDPPSAGVDFASLNEDSSILVDVLANDSDADGDTLQAVITQGPSHGTAVVTGGKIQYTPQANFSGSDSLSYRAVDGSGLNGWANVYLTVLPVNDPPFAVADSRTVSEDITTTIVVTANDQDPDNDPLTVSTYTNPAHGTVTLSGDRKSFNYRGSSNYNGPDSLSYSVTDGKGGFSTAAVSIIVTPVNDAPMPVLDNATTPKNVAVLIPVLANDSDPEGSPLTIVSVTNPASGTVTIVGSTLRFTPATNFVGLRTFYYTVSDGSLTSYAQVRVTVTN